MLSKLRHNTLINLMAIAFILISIIVCSAENANYVYDNENRLIRAEYENGTIINYSYDKVGNLVLRTYGISVTPASYDFNDVYVGNTSSPNTFTVTNGSNATLIIGTISMTGADALQFSKQGDTCSGRSINPSSSCTVEAVFSPTSAGTKSAMLSIPSNNPDMPILNVSLSGTGLAPDISLSPTSYNFGNVNAGSPSSAQIFTVTNTGNANLIIGAISMTGTDALQFSKQGDTCSGRSINPSSSCTVEAVFSPTSAGTKSARLSIPSNDSDTPILNVSLSGTGLGIRVNVPNGGENWHLGNTYTISWIYNGNVGTSVKIELLKSGRVKETITKGTSIGSGGSGSYNWAIKRSLKIGSDYQIKVTSTSNNIFSDVSDNNFAIIK